MKINSFFVVFVYNVCIILEWNKLTKSDNELISTYVDF